MNATAKEFILSLEKEEAKKFRLAFSFKATKDTITRDRVCIVYNNATKSTLIYIINKITNNNKILNWFNSIFRPGKTVIFSFTENLRKIYVEKGNIIHMLNDKFFNYSIEWEIGNEDNYKSRNYSWVHRDPDSYKDLISPILYDYINFSQCLLRTDGQVYIRHRKIDGKNVELTKNVYAGLMATLLNLQDSLDDVKKHENLNKLKQWLNLHHKRKAVFNWIQITEDNMTIYVS